MHSTPRRFLLSTSILVAACSPTAPGVAAGVPVDFATQIQPLLQEHCLDCHGAEKQRGGLRLDGRDVALRGGDEHGAAILPGKSLESPLYHLASGKDPDLKMPPKGPALSAAELELLKRWIDAGAQWPDDNKTPAHPAKTHWAYQPIASFPDLSAKEGPSAVLDHFIAVQLEKHQLHRASEADRRTLIRRLSFDLVGLPPSPEEVAQFVADPDPLAYPKLVEKLLASPRYGERWARHWLDVVRFAESDGFEKNTPRPEAWPYRDYVIRAFNEDRPYNQFVREQLAGDVLGEDVATGFIVGGPTDTVRSPDPVLTAQQRADDLNDMVATTGSTFLGLTIGCARCHSHKFDPVTHSDYYALAAMFAGVRHGTRPMKTADDAVRLARAAGLRAELAPVVTQLNQFEPMAHTRRTVVIPPDDAARVVKLKPSNAQRTKYEGGPGRGENSFPGDAQHSPTLADGYWVWLGDNAAGKVLAWQPQVQGRFRIWVSWGSGYRSHDEDARYILDDDGKLETTQDQHEIARADHRKFADGTGTMPNRKLWSGFKDIGVHELEAGAKLILEVGGDAGYPTADILVLQEESAPQERPALRLPVSRKANVERFPEVEASFVRFTIEETTQLQPCLDELEVFSAGPEPRNVGLASAGATATASSTLPGYAIHQLRHVNDGLYGNDNSWISNENGRGWVQLKLARPTRIDRVVWSRDRQNVPRYNDRLPIKYRVEVSQDGQAWTRVAGHEDRLPRTLTLAAASLATSTGLPPGEAAKFHKLQDQRKQLEAAIAVAETAPMAYAGVLGKPGETRRYQRGDVTQPREEVAPGVVAALHPIASLPKDAPDPQRRLALADWIADPQNPLTARVMANRIWHYHFGTGLVDTPSDLGVNGSRPTHPELLDWLAQELMTHGWSVKHLHRVILLSQTYRQSSSPADLQAGMTHDAQTRLLWRFPPRRLEAEVLRDTILSASNKLDLHMGGPGFDLFEPNTNYVKIYNSKSEFGAGDFRRMIYQHKPRVQLDNVFGAFDCPDAGQIAPRRNVSTTPLQALSLLNSTFALEQAGFFAARVAWDAGNIPASQVDRAFQIAFNRAPSLEEAAAAAELVAQHGLPSLCRALINSNEFIQIF
ncbi:DUF1553 domain-containing protein [Verrucomicrobium sp. BvORR106]|uniref:DUF1553 domain-containing protein n=1 Tax=Verrucomicrobium sp. BvORR106 TaxID=1403819 RepID=UPI0006907610|nr:DUF1553 domain-containing protein [Verrucomicrobium sp. BvORR106]